MSLGNTEVYITLVYVFMKLIFFSWKSKMQLRKLNCLQFVVGLTLDHADIIGSVSYSQSDDPLVPPHQLHHLSFLHWSDPTADDCFTQTRQIQQHVLQLGLQSLSLQGKHIHHT